jgi:hypothetical protein
VTKFWLTDAQMDEQISANLRACERFDSLELDEAASQQVWDGLYAILIERKRQVRDLFALDPRRSVLFPEFPDLLWAACDPQLPIVYAPILREFGLPVFDGGPSYLTMKFDPWTGKALPPSVRDAYFTEVEKRLGLEVGILDEALETLPAEFRGEAWWIERGL